MSCQDHALASDYACSYMQMPVLDVHVTKCPLSFIHLEIDR